MKKQIYILNGTGGSGKDTFCDLLDKYVSVFHYSSIRIPKDMARAVDSGTEKSEKYRRFLSDLKNLITEYNDYIFKDLRRVVDNFKKWIITDVLIIDIREPKEIARAVKEFGAKTILIRNPNVEPITSNTSDANVEMYNYDYTIDNDGTIEDFEKKVKEFYETVILSANKDLAGKVISVDFDRTLSNTINYPECGEPIEEVCDYIRDAHGRGATIILNTLRENEYLDLAKEWCREHNVPIDYWNENVPERIKEWGCNPRKISADEYIDDHNKTLDEIINGGTEC